MAISEESLAEATARGEAARRAGHAITAEYEAGREQLVLGLGNGVTIMIPVQLVEGLAGAAAADLAEIEISPAGLGLYFPRLDADVYVPALMQGVFGSKRWMAAQLGAAGGRASNPAKAAAARRNGRRGGRPRKEG